MVQFIMYIVYKVQSQSTMHAFWVKEVILNQRETIASGKKWFHAKEDTKIVLGNKCYNVTGVMQQS